MPVLSGSYFPLLLLSICVLTRLSLQERVIGNSSIACSQGKPETSHNLSCLDLDPTGQHNAILIRKVFYGSAPTARGCPSSTKGDECIFESPEGITSFAESCNGRKACSPGGRSVPVPSDACAKDNDLNLYPMTSSFSFIEFECLKAENVVSFCASHAIKQTSGGVMYLERDYIADRNTTINTTACVCDLITACESTVNFTADDLLLQTEDSNQTCTGEIHFEDLLQQVTKSPGTTKTVTCQDGGFVQNEHLFASRSHGVRLTFRVSENVRGRILIRATSSRASDTIKLLCEGWTSVTDNFLKDCDPSVTTPTTTTTTTDVDATTNSSSPAAHPSSRGEPDSIGLIVALVITIIISIVAVVIVILFVCRQRKHRETVNISRDDISTIGQSESFDTYRRRSANRNSEAIQNNNNAVSFTNHEYDENDPCLEDEQLDQGEVVLR